MHARSTDRSPIRVAPFLGAEHGVLLPRPTHEHHPSAGVKCRRRSNITSSFRSPLAKFTRSMPSDRANRSTSRMKRSLILLSGAVDAIGNPSYSCMWCAIPTAYCNLG